MNTPTIPFKEKLLVSVQNLKNGLFEFLFRQPSSSYWSKAGNYFVLGTAYLMGAFHWAWFIHYGKVRDRFVDWQHFYDYYVVIQKALTEKAIPYFMPYLYLGTNQFFAIPETDLSPTIILLNYMSVEEFFLTQGLVVYSLGFLGCLYLKVKYQWSLFTFLFFCLVFNLNGHVTAHLAVGHWSWVSYFLFPFFIGWVLSLVEGNLSMRHAGKLAFVLFGILLLGGLHPFVWCLLFLFFLGLFQKRYWKPILMGVGLAFVFSSYRILPAAVTFGGFKNPFMFGFPSPLVFWDALTQIYAQRAVHDPIFERSFSMPWWEMDHYITILGLGVLLYFGLWSRLRKPGNEESYKALNVPMLALTVFSISSIFGLIAYLPIPLISVERVPSRFLILPILTLLTLSCIEMQRMFDHLRPSWGVSVLAVAGLVYEGVYLVKHSSAWYERLVNIRMPTDILQQVVPSSDWAKSVQEYYVLTVQISYVISVAALLAFVAGSLYLKMKRSAPEKDYKI